MASRPASQRGRPPLLLGLLVVLAQGLACPAWEAVRYVVHPDAPVFHEGDTRAMPGLSAPVRVTARRDGLWRIEAEDEIDAIRVAGYLQARDRMAQLDIFRHMARGELAALLGNRSLAGEDALALDVRNRFLGFRDQAELLLDATSAQERAALDAFADGVNQWLAEGRPSLEQRLLGQSTPRPWTPQDSLSIYGFIMYGLGGNADREIRRLRLACAAGLDVLERVWPQNIEFDVVALPEADWPSRDEPLAPAVAPELAGELSALCASGSEDDHRPLAKAAPATGPAWLDPGSVFALAGSLSGGLSASNNWAIAGRHTASGKPLLASDPHLPHMNPPIVWGFEMSTPASHVAGFTLPGLHRVVFGHNGRVAFGATTNHVDRQDLVVHRASGEAGHWTHYEVAGRPVAFRIRTERFEVRGGETVEARVRFTRDGPLLNDLEPALRGHIPPTSLRRVTSLVGGDLDGARAIGRARDAREFAAGIARMDLGCSSWIYADTSGHIGYRSPCLVPIRHGWRGTFPVPGWLDRYRWSGVYDKSMLPRSDDPARGWLASANNQIIPSRAFPSTYNSDASAPNRFLRIRQRIEASIEGGEPIGPEASAAIQLDTRQAHWPDLRAELASGVCAPSPVREESGALATARRLLCDWDGDMAASSAAATLYTYWTHAVLDAAFTDELSTPEARQAFEYAESLLQFEVNVAWLWTRPADDPVWDDARTERREGKQEIFERALQSAVEQLSAAHGADLASWQWGHVRPFVLSHLFAGKGGVLGWLLDSEPLALGGGTETPFKQQFPRSDRQSMRSRVGPPLRLSIDLAEPWSATYALAGGESGWPRSAHYGDGLAGWARGQRLPLTPGPSPDDVHVRFLPAP